jgi:hypothetical protein
MVLVSNKYAQTLGRRQDIRPRCAHGGDDMPIMVKEITGDFAAEAGGTAGDQNRFHRASWFDER